MTEISYIHTCHMLFLYFASNIKNIYYYTICNNIYEEICVLHSCRE